MQELPNTAAQVTELNEESYLQNEALAQTAKKTPPQETASSDSPSPAEVNTPQETNTDFAAFIRYKGIHYTADTLEEFNTIVEEIKASGAKVIYAALGSPKQEKFVRQHGQEAGQ